MRRAAGDAWDPVRGVYRGRGVFEYREGVADPASTDPDTVFYAAQNPNQRNGDGLVVLVACDARNLAGLAVGALRRALRLRRPSPTLEPA